MMTLRAVSKPEEQEVVWEAFPSWAHFSWLYLLSAISGLRGALFFRFGVGGWEMWMGGAGMLIVCAAILRRWAHYEFTRDQIMVRNSYTGREIHSIPLSNVGDVEVQQGRVADFFGIGTVLVHARSGDRLLSLRGVSDPEAVKMRIEALAWKHNRAVNHPLTDS
ncbi:MAG: PH domain-containing protein [Nitrospirae bacterium]|nr:PH domain-containing protein [Nitrospirota bacterium]